MFCLKLKPYQTLGGKITTDDCLCLLSVCARRSEKEKLASARNRSELKLIRQNLKSIVAIETDLAATDATDAAANATDAAANLEGPRRQSGSPRPQCLPCRPGNLLDRRCRPEIRQSRLGCRPESRPGCRLGCRPEFTRIPPCPPCIGNCAVLRNTSQLLGGIASHQRTRHYLRRRTVRLVKGRRLG